MRLNVVQVQTSPGEAYESICVSQQVQAMVCVHMTDENGGNAVGVRVLLKHRHYAGAAIEEYPRVAVRQ